MNISSKIILIERGDHFYEIINGMPEKRTEFWFKERLKKTLIKLEGWKKIELSNGDAFEGFFYEGVAEDKMSE